MRKLNPAEARRMSSLRKKNSGGRPVKYKARCKCGAMSAKRAKARFHHCEIAVP